MRPFAFALPAFIVLLATACSESGLAPVTDVPPEVRTAPTTAALSGQTLSLEAYPWRDFMPGSYTSPDGSPLMVALRVHAAGDAVVDPALQAEAAWVVYGEMAWRTRPAQERPPAETSPYLEFMARGGPRWGPDVRVDVVVRLRDRSGNVVLLRAPDRLIAATY